MWLYPRAAVLWLEEVSKPRKRRHGDFTLKYIPHGTMKSNVLRFLDDGHLDNTKKGSLAAKLLVFASHIRAGSVCVARL